MMKELIYNNFEYQPIGNVYFASYEEKLVCIEFSYTSLQEFADKVEYKLKQDSSSNITAISQLKEYFSGSRKEFSIDVEFLIGTDFQQRVWKELYNIPYGKTVSYKDLAERIGSPKATRAVGSANGKNPLPIIYPCHRVINSNGDLGGYSGGLEIKKFLLNLEK